MEKNKLTLAILKNIVITLKKSEDMEELHTAACENNAAFNVRYGLQKAGEDYKEELEHLWSALGAACGYDLRNIDAAIEEEKEDNEDGD